MAEEKPRQATPVRYTWTYRHGVDEKRRIQIPSKWRPDEPGFEFSVIVWPKAKEGACLRVLPPERMAALLADIDALPNGDPNKTTLKRVIGRSTEQVALDKAGRICLPEEMLRAAGIGEVAVLVGLMDRFEIWSPERYEAVAASDNIMSPEAFRMME